MTEGSYADWNPTRTISALWTNQVTNPTIGPNGINADHNVQPGEDAADLPTPVRAEETDR
jgi:hypothetical protein